jgi:hypothetical protein
VIEPSFVRSAREGQELGGAVWAVRATRVVVLIGAVGIVRLIWTA